MLRRDLALFREKAGHQKHASVAIQTAQQGTETVDSATAPVPVEDVTMQDVTMEDAEPQQQTDIVTKAEPKVESPDQIHTPQPEPIDVKTAPSTENHDPENHNPESHNPEDTQPESRRDGAAPAPTEVPDTKPADSALQLDTAPPTIKTDKTPEDEKAPGTAKESINNDLDSLFGGGDTSNEPNSEFAFDENATGEIDFGDFTNFGTDNGESDNISSLLPGLEDYANTQSNASGADLDLSSFFTTNNNDANHAATQPAASEQRDTTFDDLMDLANFDGTAMGEDANNSTDLADFESLFN